MDALEGSEGAVIDVLVDGGALTEFDRLKIENLSREWRAGPIDVALSTGLVRPEEMARAVARVSGFPLLDSLAEPLDARLPRLQSLSDLSANRILPWRREGQSLLIAAVNPYAARTAIAEMAGSGPAAIRIATERTITDGLLEAMSGEAVEQAVLGLSDRSPMLSARGGLTFSQGAWLATSLVLLAFAFWRTPGASFAIAGIVSGIFFIGTMMFRLVLMIAGLTAPRAALDFGLPSADAGSLPMYSILVALRDEASLLPQIIGALQALDYPATKLDILLLLEETDTKTQSAARALKLDSRFRILIVPDRLPRTKPKACNFGLAFARGEFVVLYDAEDRPDPLQLQRALAAFEARAETQCVQARLGFYNARENWLTRQFAIEFAQWFAFMLPGLARFRLPVPLGGTSNHFRRSALDRLGGWDAFNVTEDADIGIRLARLDGGVCIIASETAEEANCELGNWLHQRSRWLKGYLQTWMVHMREPLKLASQLGFAGFIGFQMLIGGALASALLHLAFWAALVFGLCGGTLPNIGWAHEVWPFTLAVLVCGNGAAILSGVIAAFHPQFKRQGRLILALNAVSMPLYWFLISFAALKAIASFISRPFYWAKTRHGISRFEIARVTQSGLNAGVSEQQSRVDRSRHKLRDE